MPTSVEIDIIAPRFIEIPEHRLHAIACDLVEGHLAEETSKRHRSQDKPWTVWPFRELSLPGIPEGSVALRLRVNWASDSAPPDRLTHAMPSRLRLGSYQCQVLNKTYRLREYSRLLGGPRASAARLLFHRPTYFRRNGTDAVRLDPFLIFNSLARKWNNHCPSDLLLDWEDVKALQGASTLVILDGDVERVRERGRGVREGFVGVATMEATAQEGLFSSLMGAVEFLGVGAGTTRGYGVVEAQLLAS